mmetsp:Transcript_38595/g.34151  ORF Transcript_38595/g.34151 Transcript_38595/m.34151 type:complete len:460 (-) Transcript_38595:534-1913(-)
MQKLQIDSQKLKSLSCQTISFSRSNGNAGGQHYRGITDVQSMPMNNNNINGNFIPSQIKSMCPEPLSATNKSQSCSVIQFSLNTQYPASKVLPQPLNIGMTDMDIENDQEISMSMTNTVNSIILNETPSLVENNNNNLSSTTFGSKYCNDINSYLADIDCIQVLNILNNILSEYNDDIDFKIDYNNKQIHGLVFINNYSLFFIIYVWAENDKQTRFEFRRQNGDSLCAAKFWAEIKSLFTKQQNDKFGASVVSQQMDTDNDDDEEGQQLLSQPLDFISLDLSLGIPMNIDNEQNGGHMSKSELNQLTQSLIENEIYVVDELNYLYESMLENKNICFDILSYKPLMKQLINESILNKDVCVVRTALFILDHISQQIKDHNITMDKEYKLFNNINLLLNHETRLVKKYTIRLLANLSSFENQWTIDDISKSQIIENIKQYQTEFANHLSQEINKIHQKLMQ